MKEFIERYYYRILLVLILVVHVMGLFCDIFNGDSALYASIARNMADSGNPWILNSIMQPNWIDKPHFAFWIWSVFIRIFGNTNLGFKLPSFLALLCLLRYVFLFANRFYNRDVAWIVIIILSSSLHIFISTNDVRIDLFLICFMMAGIYHLQKYWAENQFYQLALGVIFSSMAVMTKGIYVLIPIGLSVLVSATEQRRFRRLFHYHWMFALVLFWVCISPVLYALKLQFDQFDHSLILGQKATNYLRFFFWDSQFGRFNSNLGQVASNGDPTFYLHTILWALAPWSLLLLLAFFLKRNPLREYITLTCALALLTVLSLSKTQLSHHVLILFPFLSILLAAILSQTEFGKGKKWLMGIHFGVLVIVIISSLGLVKFFLGHSSVKMMVCLALLVCVVWYGYTLRLVNKLVLMTCLVSLYLGWTLQSVLYPEVLRFQSGRHASGFISKMDSCASVEEFYTNISLLNYYSIVPVKNSKLNNLDSLLQRKNQVLFANTYGVNFLRSNNIPYKVLKVFLDYRTTVLSKDFLDHTRRKDVCDQHYLVVIRPN